MNIVMTGQLTTVYTVSAVYYLTLLCPVRKTFLMIIKQQSKLTQLVYTFGSLYGDIS